MKPRLVAFAALCAVQLAVPAWSVLDQERALAEGEVWRFRTAPVDPYDAFRGRYVSLGLDATRDDLPLPPGAEVGDTLWALLEEDPEGFARIVELRTAAPAGDAAVAVTVQYLTSSPEAGRVPGRGSVTLPFTTYWMPEGLAPRAEQAVRDATWGDPSAHEAWVTVRVRGRTAALEDLWIDGRTIREVLATP